MRGAWWFVTRKLHASVGGMERLSQEVTSRLAQRRPVCVVAPSSRLLGLPVFLMTAALRVLVGCLRCEIQVLHLGDPVLAPIGAIARAFDVPVAVSIHGLDVVYPNVIYRVWRRAFLRGFGAYICISRAARNAAIDAAVPPDHIYVIGVGVDVPNLSSSPISRADDNLLYVGRLVRRKGLAWFVEAVLPQVAAYRPGLRLEIIGDGPQRQEIAAASLRAGVADRLLWRGVVSETAKCEALVRATICVMPNVVVPGDMEGLGLVALEAAASGCPLIASRVDGLVDAVAEGESGVLVPPGDADAWVKELQACLDDPAGRDAAGRRARAHALAHHQWDDIIDRYEDVLAMLVSGIRAPSNPQNVRGRLR